MYIYRTEIFKMPTEVIGLSESEATAHQSAKVAFETAEKKQTALKVNTLQVAETSFFIDKTYAQFETIVTGYWSWADVRYVEQPEKYDIYLLTSTPI